MEKWKVMVYVDGAGRCPFSDEWLASQGVTKKDVFKVHTKFQAIEETADDLPPKWWSRYKSSEGLYELRVTGPGKKMLRPLGIRTGPRELLIFFGSVEKGNRLDSSDLSKAEALKKEYESGTGTKRCWYD